MTSSIAPPSPFSYRYYTIVIISLSLLPSLTIIVLPNMAKTEELSLTLPVGMKDRIDRMKGQDSRSAFVARILERSLTASERSSSVKGKEKVRSKNA